MNMMKNPVLVFNCHFNGLSIIQALGRRGVQIYALDSIRSVGTFSRYAKFWQSPDPLNDEEGFIDFLLDKGPSFNDKPILFPTNDQWATAISKNKKQLQQYYIPCVADWSAVDLVVNKDKFYSWATDKGYPVPRLYLHNEVQNAVFPIIVKPRYRCISGLASGKPNLSKNLDAQRMVIFKTLNDYEQYINTNKELLQYLIFQEYVPGLADSMYTVGIYANNESKILGMFTGRKVRGYPPDIGDCVVGQNEKLPQVITGMVKNIVEALNYKGIAEFEFKKNSTNGEWRLIEINPRSWSWIGITPVCGVDLPWIAYSDLAGIVQGNYEQDVNQDGEVKYIKVLEDFRNCLYLNKKHGFPQYHMNFREWWRSLDATKKVYAGFSWDDPVPGLFQLTAQGRNVIKALFSKS